MDRMELARLLEGEGLNAAAEDVRGGGNAAAICAQAVQVGPRYDDGFSREVMATCREIAEGKLGVTESFKDIAAKWAEGNMPEPDPADEVDA